MTKVCRNYSLVVFDVDGTFYRLSDVVADNYRMQMAFYSEHKGIDPEETKEIFRKQGILDYQSTKAKSATEFFLQDGIDPGEWNAYRNIHYPVRCINPETSVNNHLLEKFANKARLAILSSNSKENIQRILQWLNIDQNLFASIFCSSNAISGSTFKKAKALPILLKNLGINAENTLAVGDRYESDIKPIIDLGGDGILVSEPGDLWDIYHLFFLKDKGKNNRIDFFSGSGCLRSGM